MCVDGTYCCSLRNISLLSYVPSKKPRGFRSLLFKKRIGFYGAFFDTELHLGTGVLLINYKDTKAKCRHLKKLTC
jgi:hypothetical protein